MPTPAPDSLLIQTLELKKAALLFRAINHKLRQQILQLLHKREEMIVTDIYVKMRITQSEASQHLAILRKAGLVYTERQGKKIYYSVNEEQLKLLHDMADQLLKKKP